MGNEKIAKELLALAKELTGASTFSDGYVDYPNDSKYARLMSKYLAPPHPDYPRDPWYAIRDWAKKVRPSMEDMEALLIANDMGYTNEILRHRMDTVKDVELIARRMKIGSAKVAGANGPVMSAIQAEWNTLHDIESLLEDAAQRYDVAASYSGEAGERDARQLMNEILKAKKELEHISTKTFGKIADLEVKFERKHGEVEDYITRTRNKIFSV